MGFNDLLLRPTSWNPRIRNTGRRLWLGVSTPIVGAQDPLSFNLNGIREPHNGTISSSFEDLVRWVPISPAHRILPVMHWLNYQRRDWKSKQWFIVGGNATSAFMSWRLQATNACDVTLVWKNGFESVSQYGISFRFVYKLQQNFLKWLADSSIRSKLFGNERFKPRHGKLCRCQFLFEFNVSDSGAKS